MYLRREWYPHSDGVFLEPDARRWAILDHLEHLDADVLCLQEVEAASFTAIESHLVPLGYRGVFAPKGRGRPDGCATFHRPAVLAAVASARVEYDDAEPGQEPSGHVALLVALLHEGLRVGIANTHLRWQPPDTEARESIALRQVAQLLRERDAQLPGCDAWIVCGDLNFPVEAPPVARLLEAGLTPAHAGLLDAFTTNTNGRPKAIDHLLHDEGLRAEPRAPAPITATTPLPGPGQPSDHLALIARFRARPSARRGRTPEP